jgi:hypothetical protein
MKTYLVYLDQINPTKWEVKAESKTQAAEKARKLWLKEYGKPLSITVIEDKGR